MHNRTVCYSKKEPLSIKELDFGIESEESSFALSYKELVFLEEWRNFSPKKGQCGIYFISDVSYGPLFFVVENQWPHWYHTMRREG
jgi:hypothetical protein